MGISLRSSAAFLFLGGFLLPGVAVAQADRVTVEGVVVDQDYQALHGITVVAAQPEGGAEHSALTDKRGYFNLGSLPLGTYRVQLIAPEGAVLFEAAYRIGDRIVTGLNGERAEQLLVIQGEGIYSLGESDGGAGVDPVRLARKRFRGSGSGWTGNASLLLGLRSLDDTFWGALDTQGVFGLDIDFGRADWPIHVALGLHHSDEKERGACLQFICFGFPGEPREILQEMSMNELDVGFVKVFAVGESARPFVGSGIAFVDVELDLQELGREDDQSQGWFARGGVFWTSADMSRLRWNYGFEVKLLVGTDIRLRDTKGDADYLQIAFLLGNGW